MLKQILRINAVLMFAIGLVLFIPSGFAQGHQDRSSGGNAGNINRGFNAQGHGQRHGTRHYYHNGNWNRNGWYGWGVAAPIFTAGVLVASLPPGYTTVVVSGNTYYYGENTYFSPMSTGGYAVVSLPVSS